MTREEARALLKEYNEEPVRGSTYMPVPICEWMVDALIQAYVLGMQDGKAYAMDGE